MVFHFGCELHEQYSFPNMLANTEEPGRQVLLQIQEGKADIKRQNTENNKLWGKKKKRNERDWQTNWQVWMSSGERERDGKGIQWMDAAEEEGEGEAAQFMPLSPCSRTPPWGDSDFKPLPCFIFPWLLQPDQSTQLPQCNSTQFSAAGPPEPSTQGGVLGGLEAGGRQICTWTTAIPVLEADDKRLYQWFFWMCLPITTIHMHFTLLSAVLKAGCSVLRYNLSQSTMCLLLFFGPS